jgi:hypothetical protein
MRPARRTLPMGGAGLPWPRLKHCDLFCGLRAVVQTRSSAVGGVASKTCQVFSAEITAALKKRPRFRPLRLEWPASINPCCSTIEGNVSTRSGPSSQDILRASLVSQAQESPPTHVEAHTALSLPFVTACITARRIGMRARDQSQSRSRRGLETTSGRV